MRILIEICSSNLKKQYNQRTQRALVKEQFRLDMRKYSFSQKVIHEWNKLPNDCVNASSVSMFKNRIDRYLIRAGYTYMRKLLDSRQANGFLVHLPSGACCLGWQSC